MQEQDSKAIDYTEEDFSIYIPISKAISSRKVENPGSLRWIEGLASTETKDLQGEVVDQKGIDFSYALNQGYFNNDHKPGPRNKIGEITEMTLKSVDNPKTGKKDYGLWVKGFLYNNHTVADDYWELLNAQESTPGSNRRVGFSIQGKVKKRFGNRILKCWVMDIAITAAPINTDTWASVVKSLLMKSARCLHPNSPQCVGCNIEDCAFARKSFDIEKAVDTADTQLLQESLEKDKKVLLYKDENGKILKGDMLNYLNQQNLFPENSLRQFVDMIYLFADKMEMNDGGNQNV